MTLPFGFDSGMALYLAAALLVAAFVRGYSGFGFSAIFIAFAALVTNPLPLIPVVFSCEILMTAFQARGIRRHVDWRRALFLLAGAALATVPAIALMARLGEEQARLAVSIIVFVLSVLLLSGFQIRRPLGAGGHMGAGIVAGIANSAGVGGLPTAAFLAAQGLEPAVFRATMIVFLTGIDFMALPVMAASGLVGPETGLGIILAFPVLGVGIWLGSGRFAHASREHFRWAVALLLAALSVLNIMQVL